MRTLYCSALAMLLAGTTTPAFAEKLQVVTSIRPIHSIVEYVSDGHADVSNLVPANASPHNYALKPSDAKKNYRMLTLSFGSMSIWKRF